MKMDTACLQKQLLALFAVHACHQPLVFLLATFRQKQKLKIQRIKRVVLGIGFSIAGNEKNKNNF
jgi:hypothetical protein